MGRPCSRPVPQQYFLLFSSLAHPTFILLSHWRDGSSGHSKLGSKFFPLGSVKCLDYLLGLCHLVFLGYRCLPSHSGSDEGGEEGYSCLTCDTHGFVQLSDTGPFRRSWCVTSRFILKWQYVVGTKPSTEQFAVDALSKYLQYKTKRKGNFSYLLLKKLKIAFKTSSAFNRYLWSALCVSGAAGVWVSNSERCSEGEVMAQSETTQGHLTCREQRGRSWWT